jgi:CheY-like chemotaxis protein
MISRAPILLVIQPVGGPLPVGGVEDGFLTLRASEAEAGYEIARTKRPDVIALDINVDGGSGWAICRLLKRDPMTASIPVIIVNAPDTAAVAAHAHYVGATAVFAEPASASGWLSAVRDAMARSSAA